VVQSRAAGAELLGVGSGDPGQTYSLAQRPVLAGSVALEVEEPSGWRRWTEVADLATLAASTPGDRHYTVDTVSGLVHFGTERTRVPQPGERIRVTGYRHGGGADGNVAAAAITSLSGVAGVKVTNVLPAEGGADPASLAEALEEIPAAVHRRDRAVTVDDFRALSLEVPGVVRAEPLPTFHPDTPTQRAAGVVTVVVFPAEDRRDPAAPEPDLALLRHTATYLNARRLVTTELYVVPPTYRPIAVSVGVRVRQGHQVDGVRRWVEQILRQYLAPVPPFGPDGDGWPMGRAVRRAELHAVAVQVEGVEFVEDLLLARIDAQGTAATPADLVTLQDWEVPRIATLTVVSGTPLPVGTGYDLPAPGPQDPVVVVLPADVC
jgi:predicted phage baseplate assembly protein